MRILRIMTSKILATYLAAPNSELEIRFNISSRDTFKKLITSCNGPATLEQTINLLSPSNDITRIATISFLDGIKHSTTYSSKRLLVRSDLTDTAPLPYRITLSEERPLPPFNINLSKFARIKLRLSIRPSALPSWRFDFTLIKTVNDIKSTLKVDKTSMLFPGITPSTFLRDAPWDYADTLEFEAEHLPSPNNELTPLDITTTLNYISKLIDPDYQNIFEYQSKIYQVATYLVDKSSLPAFKDTRGLRDLYNRVIELNKANYFTTVFPHIKDYYLLDKADGTRTIGILEGSTLSLLGTTLTTLPLATPHPRVTIFDSEHVGDSYYVFDVIAFNGENISKTPTSNRIKQIAAIVAMVGPPLVAKNIISLTDNYRREITTMASDTPPHPYQTDGLIFTPKNSPYTSMKSWKWKPLDHMSIDFLVKLPPSSLLGVHPYIAPPNHTLLFLFCGISKQLFDKLRLTTVPGYKKIFPHQDLYKNFPIQFAPSDDPFAYIYAHPDNSSTPLSAITDSICEFKRIDLSTDHPQWSIMRVRTDRKSDLARGNYFGNGFYVAEYTWLNYQNPLLLDDLTISSTEFMDRGYFQTEKADTYKPVTAFNSFVKGKLLAPYAKSTWLVDLAAGRGQDMFRVSDAHIQNALFLDSDAQALSELVSRKHDFQRGVTRLNTRIFTKLANLSQSYETTIASLAAMNIPIGLVDVVMCNFAIHYLLATPDSARNFIALASALLRPGGHLFFTAFDGAKIFKLLRATPYGVWDARDDTVLKYSIRAAYKSDSFEPTGQPIDVLLPFSGGKYYTEYLVNFDYIADELSHNGFSVERVGNFSEYLSVFKSESSKNHTLLTANDIAFTSLYGYGVFKRNQTPNGTR